MSTARLTSGPMARSSSRCLSLLGDTNICSVLLGRRFRTLVDPVRIDAANDEGTFARIEKKFICSDGVISLIGFDDRCSRIVK
jgi:hypothetical protein